MALESTGLKFMCIIVRDRAKELAKANKDNIDGPDSFMYWISQALIAMQVGPEVSAQVLQEMRPKEVGTSAPTTLPARERKSVAEWNEEVPWSGKIKKYPEMPDPAKHGQANVRPKSKRWAQATCNKDKSVYDLKLKWAYAPRDRKKLVKWRMKQITRIYRDTRYDLHKNADQADHDRIMELRRGYDLQDSFVVLDYEQLATGGDPYYRIYFVMDRRDGAVFQYRDYLTATEGHGIAEVLLGVTTKAEGEKK